MPNRFARPAPAALAAPPSPKAKPRAGGVRATARPGDTPVIALALLVALAAGIATPAQAAGKPPRPRLCPEDAPEGVRLPPRPGCAAREPDAPRRDGGFHDLGGGSGIRIGGRVGAVFDGRR